MTKSPPNSGTHSGSIAARWPCLALLVICAVVYGLNLGSLQIGQHVDDAIYISLARSINAGLGYVRFEDPAHPPEPQYPPAMAYLVATVLALSGGNLQALLVIPVLFSLVSLVLACVFFHRRMGWAVRANPQAWIPMLVALFGLNHLIVGYSGMIMTEAPFVCLTLAAIVWLDRLRRDDPHRTQQRSSVADRPSASVGWTVVMAAILAACCLMRTAGYVYVVAGALYLWHTGYRPAVVAVVVLTVALLMPWLALQKQVTGAWFGGGYLADMLSPGDTHWHPAVRPAENLLAYGSELLPAAVLPFFGQQVRDAAARFGLGWLLTLFGLLVSAAIVAGGWHHRRPGPDPAAYICVALVALLLLWPYSYTRFCLPLLPLCLVYLLAAGDRLSTFCGRFIAGLRAASPAPSAQSTAWLWAGAALVLAGFVVRDVNMLYNPPRHAYADLQQIAHFIENHTPAHATIITGAPSAAAVYAHRAFMDLLPPKRPGSAATPDPAEFLARSEPYRPRYVLIHAPRPGEPAQIPDFLQQPPFRLHVRDEQLGAVLFEVDQVSEVTEQTGAQ